MAGRRPYWRFRRLCPNTLARWGTIAGVGPQDFPALWDYVHKVAANEAVAKVIARERLQLNLMASS